MKKSLLLFSLAWTSFIMGMEAPTAAEIKTFFDALNAGNVSEVERLGKESLLDKKNDNGDTPLIAAVKKNDRPMVEEILRQIREIENKNSQLDIYFIRDNLKGDSALAVALNGKKLDMIKTLLYYAPQSMDIDPRRDIIDRKVDISGNTPLILAIKTHQKDIIEALLAQLPDPNIKNNLGKTAFDFANDAEKKLLEQAQKQYDFWHQLLTIARKTISITSTDLADLAKLIKPNVVNVNAVGFYRNLLFPAISSGSLDLVTLIVNSVNSAQITNFINKTWNGGVTPLFWAVLTALQPGYPAGIEIIKFLLEKGANPNTPPDIFYHHIPLSLALLNNNTKIIELLIAHGANVNYRPSDGITVLMQAVLDGNIDRVKTILALKPDLTIQNLNNETALQIAERRFNKAAPTDKKKYEDIVNLLKEEEAKRVPVTPTTPSDSKALISVLYKLTQTLKGLQTIVLKK